MSPQNDPIIREAEHLRRAALVAAERHYAAETPWFYSNYWLGLPAAVLSAIASAAAFKNAQGSHELAGYIAIVVAILAALTAFLDPKGRANQHHNLAKSFESLYHRLGFFERLVLERGQQKADDLAQLSAFNDEFMQLVASSPPIPGRAYSRADRNMSRGWGEVARHPDDAVYRPAPRPRRRWHLGRGVERRGVSERDQGARRP